MSADVIERLTAIEATQRAILKELQRVATPVQTMSVEDVCDRLKVTRSGLNKIDARNVFTDARPPEKRLRGRSRVYFADEVGIYPSEGAAGVRRFRREVGRL